MTSSWVRYPQLADRAWLDHEYREEGRSCQEIAARVGCSPANVDLRLRQHGIPRRGRGNRTSLRPKTCERCSKSYQPTGPAQRRCDDCWPIKACQDCGAEFTISAEERRPGRGGRKYCDEHIATRRGAPSAGRSAIRVQELAQAGEFLCRDCHLPFPLEESVKDSSRASGYMERCLGCEVVRATGYRTDPVTGEAQRSRQRAFRYRKFGASEADFDRLLVEQEGRCAICRREPGPGRGGLHFDHDHAEVRPRGLLCYSCNVVLGLMGESPGRLRAAADYLEQYGYEVTARGRS